jgi:hypothetical protein
MYLSQSYYAQIEGEKREAPERIFEWVSAKYNVSKNWLKDGAGEMFGGEPAGRGPAPAGGILPGTGPALSAACLTANKVTVKTTASGQEKRS